MLRWSAWKNAFTLTVVTHHQQWSAILTRKGLVLPIAWKTSLGANVKKLNKSHSHSAQCTDSGHTKSQESEPGNCNYPKISPWQISKSPEWKWKRQLWFFKTKVSLVPWGAIHPARDSQEVYAPLSSHSNPYNRAGVKTVVPRLVAWIW